MMEIEEVEEVEELPKPEPTFFGKISNLFMKLKDTPVEPEKIQINVPSKKSLNSRKLKSKRSFTENLRNRNKFTKESGMIDNSNEKHQLKKHAFKKYVDEKGKRNILDKEYIL